MCAPKGARSERRGALHDARGCACAARRILVRVTWQVLREQEGARVYSELQSKHRAAKNDPPNENKS